MNPQPDSDKATPDDFRMGSAREALSPLSDSPGQEKGLAIPDHELLRRIGRGAYGEVWLARSALDAYRAVKVVYRNDFEDSRPFEREFAGIQKFEPISRSHPGLVHVLQVGRRGNYFYYVMELADDATATTDLSSSSVRAETRTEQNSDRADRAEAGGREQVKVQPDGPSRFPSPTLDPLTYAPRTLRRELREQGRLPADRCIEIGLSLASALGHLHEHGLVHRDVKPSNIIFVQGKPKLADIGLVTEVGDSRSIVGTEGYLPPEGPGTPQADIFSLGKVLYELSTGQDRHQFPVLPPELKDWADQQAVFEFNELVLNACAQDPAARYANLGSLLADLESLQRGKSVRRRRIVRRWLAESKRVALIGSFLMAILAAVLLVLRPRPPDHSEADSLVDEGNNCLLANLPDAGMSNAVAYFTKAIQLDPTNVPAHFGLWLAQVRWDDSHITADFSERGKLATRLYEIAPESPEALIAFSDFKWRQWDFRGALTNARSAIEKRGASKLAECAAHFWYGNYLLQTGAPAEEARREFKLGHRLDPANSVAYEHFGDVDAVQHKYSEALEQYQHCLALEPRRVWVHDRKAKVFEELGDFTNAVEEYKQVWPFARDFTAEWKTFLDELCEAARLGASDYWNKRLKMEQEDAHLSQYVIATLYMRLGKKEEAYKCLEKAREARDGALGDLLTDLCWDQQDEWFIVFAAGIGMLQWDWRGPGHASAAAQ
jgi:serine/threonine protein kinase